MPNPTHLGDGLYASWDGDTLVLTTGHHDPGLAAQVVYLEPEVLAALRRYLEEVSDA